MPGYSSSAPTVSEHNNRSKTSFTATRTSFPHNAYGLDRALIIALKESHHEFLRVAVRRTQNFAAGEELLRRFYRGAMHDRTLGKAPGFKAWLVAALRRSLASWTAPSGMDDRALAAEANADRPVPVFFDDVERTVSACLYRLLPALPKDCSWLIWQVDLLGQSFDAVARKMGISTELLMMRLQRACQVLLGVLEHFCRSCPTHGFLNCDCEPASETEPGFPAVALS